MLLLCSLWNREYNKYTLEKANTDWPETEVLLRFSLFEHLKTVRCVTQLHFLSVKVKSHHVLIIFFDFVKATLHYLRFKNVSAATV